MPLQIFTLIPAIATIIWAAVSKKRKHNDFEFIVITISGIMVICNGLIMHQFFNGLTSYSINKCIQQVISSFIVPLAYMYFAKQMGRNWNNGTSIAMGIIIILLAVPAFIVPLDGVLPVANDVIAPMTIHFYKCGKEVMWQHTADVIILIQASLTFIRMINLYVTFRRYHLTVSPKLRYFMLWWLAAICFIIYTSLNDTQTLAQPLHNWIYYCLYSALTCSIYTLLAYDFDLRPVLLAMETDTCDTTDKGEEETMEEKAEEENADMPIAVELDSFIYHSEMMASRVRQAMKEKMFLKPDLSSDSMIAMLGTNRTYFSRMMKVEFGCTFTEYIYRQRLEYSEELLRNPDLTILEVAIQSGFSDQSTFGRRFRQAYGLTPSQWRKKKGVTSPLKSL